MFLYKNLPRYLWIDEEEKVGHAKEREKDESGSDCPPHLYFGNAEEKSVLFCICVCICILVQKSLLFWYDATFLLFAKTFFDLPFQT